MPSRDKYAPKRAADLVELYRISPPVQPKIRNRIAIHWEYYRQYFPATVVGFSKEGKAQVRYDDGRKRTLDLKEHDWQFITNENEYMARPYAKPIKNAADGSEKKVQRGRIAKQRKMRKSLRRETKKATK